VCVCVCVSECEYVCVFVRACVYIYIYIHMSFNVCVYTNVISVCLSHTADVHDAVGSRWQSCMCVCVCECEPVCLCVCVNICIDMSLTRLTRWGAGGRAARGWPVAHVQWQ